MTGALLSCFLVLAHPRGERRRHELVEIGPGRAPGTAGRCGPCR
jgi:hypothetical protein